MSASPSASGGRPARTRVVVIVVSILAVLALVVGAIALAASLNGGDPQAEPSPTATESREPQAEPEPEAPARPAPRWDATCADVVDPALVAAATGLEQAPLQVGAGPVQSLDDAAQLATGAIVCRWLAADGGRLEIAVLPEGREAFQDDDEQCTAWQGSHYCSAYLVSAGAGVSVSSMVPTDRGAFDALVADVRDRVAQLPARAPAAPSDAADAYTWDAWSEGVHDGVIAEAFGVDGVAPQGYDGMGELTLDVWERTGFVLAPYATSAGSVNVTALPGAAWAAEELAALPDTAAVDIAGAEHAASLTIHGQPNVCFLLDGQALCISSPDLSPEALLSGARALVPLVAL